MNVSKLRKVKDHILEEPKRFLMANWIRFSEKGRRGFTFFTLNDKKKKREFAKCGTAACLGGWTVLLHRKNMTPEKMVESDVQSEASRILGLDCEESERLFLQSQWPEQFRTFKDSGSVQDAQIAADRIEHFIQTNGAE